jgi:LDH2 family malate/lactate/ureidoglycolate dehydrogenase
LCIRRGPIRRKSVLATREAMARTRRVGTASVALYNCGHILTAGYYVELAARENLIGLLLTRSGPVMHPHSGIEPMMGTNPIAVGVPSTTRDLAAGRPPGARPGRRLRRVPS